MKSLDLNKYCNIRDIIVPIIENKFQYNNKCYFSKKNIIDGWYLVNVKNNDIISYTVITDINKIKTRYKIISGYSFDNNIVFENFDVAKKNNINNNIHFCYYLNNIDNFTPINTVLWENGQIFFLEINTKNVLIYQLKQIVNERLDINNIKYLTPELKCLYVLNIIKLNHLEQKNKKTNIKDRIIKDRIIKEFELVNAKLLNYTINNNRIIVNWKLNNNEYNSVIDKHTFNIIEAGYCMSGDDNKHNIHSLVLTAKDYDKDGLIYITRDIL